MEFSMLCNVDIHLIMSDIHHTKYIQYQSDNTLTNLVKPTTKVAKLITETLTNKDVSKKIIPQIMPCPQEISQTIILIMPQISNIEFLQFDKKCLKGKMTSNGLAESKNIEDQDICSDSDELQDIQDSVHANDDQEDNDLSHGKRSLSHQSEGEISPFLHRSLQQRHESSLLQNSTMTLYQSVKNHKSKSPKDKAAIENKSNLVQRQTSFMDNENTLEIKGAIQIQTRGRKRLFNSAIDLKNEIKNELSADLIQNDPIIKLEAPTPENGLKSILMTSAQEQSAQSGVKNKRRINQIKQASQISRHHQIKIPILNTTSQDTLGNNYASIISKSHLKTDTYQHQPQYQTDLGLTIELPIDEDLAQQCIGNYLPPLRRDSMNSQQNWMFHTSMLSQVPQQSNRDQLLLDDNIDSNMFQ
ncbi:hypothetical protein FGO68_gene12258 [Halteria grandinella]|uniref:Uncharacterized protein n=1 Tax=Halteria grandinella TaxID=5974 RepID=A0A8J8NX45_HALGN|nr:hypothetical protein FGO68_gene12258 [Halteria grandinella]